jgi:hypothetical protein
MDLTEFNEPVIQRLAQEEADAKIGIEPDMPEELKVAIRKMGPLTRRRFFKKLYRDKITEKQYALYIQQFVK